jgi:hypothetical protein
MKKKEAVKSPPKKKTVVKKISTEKQKETKGGTIAVNEWD